MLLNVGWARGFAKKARGCCVNVSPNGLIALLLCFVFVGTDLFRVSLTGHRPSGSLSPLCGSMGPVSNTGWKREA